MKDRYDRPPTYNGRPRQQTLECKVRNIESRITEYIHSEDTMKSYAVNANKLSDNTGSVKFTRKQYEYLEKVFGENPGSPSTSDAQLRWNSGVRTVIQHVRSLVDDGKALG